MNILQENIPLAPIVSFRIGGRARYFIEAQNQSDVQKALNIVHAKQIPLFVLGSGTNILVADEGFNGVVLKILNSKFQILDSVIDASSGMLMSTLVKETTSRGLAGLEWAGGLPGTVGGAIRGNAGCFGGETKDTVVSVVAMHPETGELRTFTKSECQFEYRNSIFKKEGWVIVSTRFLLKKNKSSKDLQKEVVEKINYRKQRHPLEYPNVGSIFKNCSFVGVASGIQDKFQKFIKNDPFPIIPVAVIIADAGLAGKRVGGAMVSDKHSNFIINAGDAKASDVRLLISEIKSIIKEKYAITLEEEVQYIGYAN